MAYRVGARLIDNRIVATEGDAIRVRGHYAKVLDNRIEDALGDGICVEGTFHTVEENRIEVDDWDFENRYWVDPETGFVWVSEQHVNPDLDPLQISVLKPAG